MMMKDNVVEVEIRTSAASATVSSRAIFFLPAGDLKGKLSGNSLSLLLSASSLSVPLSVLSISLPLGVTAAAWAISYSVIFFLGGMSSRSLALGWYFYPLRRGFT